MTALPKPAAPITSKSSRRFLLPVSSALRICLSRCLIRGRRSTQGPATPSSGRRISGRQCQTGLRLGSAVTPHLEIGRSPPLSAARYRHPESTKTDEIPRRHIARSSKSPLPCLASLHVCAMVRVASLGLQTHSKRRTGPGNDRATSHLPERRPSCPQGRARHRRPELIHALGKGIACSYVPPGSTDDILEASQERKNRT